jgi:hypothetical protein
MEFPPEWNVVSADQFATAQPRAAGDLGMELLVQARLNGRMLDHFRVSLGGSRILDVSFPIANLVSSPRAKMWRAKFQICPRDVEIRRNMTSSAWHDFSTMVATNECQVWSEEEAEEVLVPQDAVKAILAEAGAAASIRYAVVIGGDQRMALSLQGLPATADQLQGKPAFRG